MSKLQYKLTKKELNDLLFEAFRKGFEASFEGFNGEYVPEPENLDADLWGYYLDSGYTVEKLFSTKKLAEINKLKK